MPLPFIGVGIASLAVIICIVLLSRKAAKKHFLELVEQSKTDFPRIEVFFSSLDTLSENYISKSDELVFKQQWESFYTEIQKRHYPSKLPDYEKIAFFLKTFSNINSEIANRNDVFLQREMRESDTLWNSQY